MEAKQKDEVAMERKVAEMRYLLVRIIYFANDPGPQFEMALKDAEDYLRSEG